MNNRSDCENSEFYLEKELLAPYTHVTQVRGKRLRRKIALAFNHWLRLPQDRLRHIVDTVYMHHQGTLLIDDIQDKSRVRRGLPAAHCVYGVPLTINTSVHIIFLVLQRLLNLHPKGAEIYAEDFLESLRGQGSELYWRENFLCPTEEEYKNMAKRKTGRMFTLVVRLCQLFSEYKSDLCQLALLLGLYFQIRDDYHNLIQQEELEEWPGVEDNIIQKAEKNTTYCDDLTEGKFSFPIIHAMNTPERGPISNILRQRTEDVDLKKYCVSLLEKAGSLQYTRDVLEDLDRSARAEVARLGGNPDMEAVLDELMSWKFQGSRKD